MSVQYSDKSANNYSTTSASMKTPFGIEDILFINNNNSAHSANKNSFNEKSCGKSAMKSSCEAEEFKKILSSER